MSDQLARITAALSDRYAVERELGRGGMATVYLARDLKHPRQVAIKVLRPELSATVGVDRFLREIDIAAQLNHPHILPLLDSGRTGTKPGPGGRVWHRQDGRTDDLLYYVMPFVEGESLREKLARERELPIADAVRILREVVDALTLAHSRGVIHRDIKPDNVMLSGRHAMVTDFGVAKALSQASSNSELTSAGMALGTPAYMSPEQAVADEQIDHRSDIYSVGALAYELLTGRPPFLGTTPQMVLSAHVADPPDPVTKYRENVSPPLAHLVKRCLEKKPADRWQSADELLVQLEAVATPSGGMTPTTTRPVATVGVGKRRRTTWAVVATLAVAVLVVLLGGVWLTQKILRPSPTEVEAATELPRLVVLPFENLGPPEDEYFADGITDEITTRLAGFSGLETIARAAAMQYKDTEKTTGEIAAELSVDYLLAGTVRWSRPAGAQSRVRVSPQLIRGSDGTQVWAEPFDAELTDVFGIQADVAEMVANALDLSLGSSERDAMLEMPTDNAEAYEYYLRGNLIFTQWAPQGEGLDDAIAQYETAVQLDPNFAVAYAKLSLAHGGMYSGGHDVSEKRIGECKAAAEEAVRLDPDLAEGHAALGMYHYRCCSDYEKALAELDLALEKRPYDPFFIALSVGPYRRSGDLVRAGALAARASDLDPTNHVNANSAANMQLLLRNYDQADRYRDRSRANQLSMAPGLRDQPASWMFYYVWKARIPLARDGDVDSARVILERGEEHSGVAFWELVTQLPKPNGRIVCAHDVDACRQGLSNATPADWQLEDMWISGYYMTMADLNHWAGNSATSRIYYDSATAAAVAERERVLSHPSFSMRQLGSQQFLAVSARISAALGDTTAALRYLEQSQEERAALVDRYAAGFEAYAPAAESYLLIGEYDAALDQIEYWLSRPSYLSVGLLRVDPIWDPIRDDPRFQALLVRYGQ
jgi:serine/threonine-protein kinase